MAFFWVGGLIFGVLGPMQIGVTILTEERFDAGEVLRLLEAEKATYATGFPHVGPALEAHPDFASSDLSALRGGYQQNLVAPEFPRTDPSLRVRQLGMTETCSSHTWWPPNDDIPEEKARFTRRHCTRFRTQGDRRARSAGRSGGARGDLRPRMADDARHGRANLE